MLIMFGDDPTTSSSHQYDEYMTTTSTMTGYEPKAGPSRRPSTASSTTSTSKKTKGTTHMDKSDPFYKEKRERNNEAVKKSREKKKIETEMTARCVERLEKDHKRLAKERMLIEVKYEAFKEIWTENFGPLDAATERSLFDP